MISSLWWIYFAGFIGFSFRIIIIDRNHEYLDKVPGWFRILSCVFWPVVLTMGMYSYLRWKLLGI